MVAVLLLLLAVSAPPDGSAANTPGTTSDFAKSIAAIEAKTGSRIGVGELDTGSGKRLDHRSKNASRCAARLNFSPPPRS